MSTTRNEVLLLWSFCSSWGPGGSSFFLLAGLSVRPRCLRKGSCPEVCNDQLSDGQRVHLCCTSWQRLPRKVGCRKPPFAPQLLAALMGMGGGALTDEGLAAFGASGGVGRGSRDRSMARMEEPGGSAELLVLRWMGMEPVSLNGIGRCIGWIEGITSGNQQRPCRNTWNVSLVADPAEGPTFCSWGLSCGSLIHAFSFYALEI